MYHTGRKSARYLTNPQVLGYNTHTIKKSEEEESTLPTPVREPRKVGGGTEGTAEHGLGAGVSIDR